MTTSCTDTNHPLYKKIIKLDSAEQIAFFKDNAKNMQKGTLGEILDFSSFGMSNCVAWNMDPKEMVGFIKEWIDAQDKYSWNTKDKQEKVILPYMNLGECSNGGHKETIKDVGGKLRCRHMVSKRNICYNIISDENTNLSLDSVINRLNVNRDYRDTSYAVPFSGFHLANYVKNMVQTKRR